MIGSITIPQLRCDGCNRVESSVAINNSFGSTWSRYGNTDLCCLCTIKFHNSLESMPGFKEHLDKVLKTLKV